MSLLGCSSISFFVVKPKSLFTLARREREPLCFCLVVTSVSGIASPMILCWLLSRNYLIPRSNIEIFFCQGSSVTTGLAGKPPDRGPFKHSSKLRASCRALSNHRPKRIQVPIDQYVTLVTGDECRLAALLPSPNTVDVSLQSIPSMQHAVYGRNGQRRTSPDEGGGMFSNE